MNLTIQQIRFIHFFIILAILLIQRLGIGLVEYLNHDEFTTFFDAQTMLQGGIWYHDFINPRYTAVLFFALAQILIPTGTTISTHILLIPLIALTGLFLMDAIRRLFNDTLAFWVGLAFVLFHGIPTPDYQAAMLESIGNLFSVGAFWCFVQGHFQQRRKWLWLPLVGVCLITAAHAKQPFLALFAIYGVYYLIVLIHYRFQKARITILEGILVLGGGILLESIIMGIHLGFHIWEPYVHYFYVINFLQYIPSGFTNTESHTWFRFFTQYGQLLGWHLLLWVGLIIGMIFLIRKRTVLPAELILVLGFLISFLLYFLGGFRFYVHYSLFFFPYLVALGIYGVYLLLEHLGSNPQMQQWITRIVLVLLLLPGLVYGIYWNVRSIAIHTTPPDTYGSTCAYLPETKYAIVLDYLKQYPTTNRYLFIWGEEPSLQYHSHLYPATPFLWCTMFVGWNETADELSAPYRSIAYAYQVLLSNLQEKKPGYILDTSSAPTARMYGIPLDAYPSLQHFVSEYYEKETELDGMVLYRLQSR